MASQVDINKLVKELIQVAPITGVTSVDGTKANLRIDFKPEATAQQRILAAEVLAAHDPEPSVQERQRQTFFSIVPAEEVLEAVIEYLLEDSPAKLQAIQAKRQRLMA